MHVQIQTYMTWLEKKLILYNTREKSSILSFILMSFHDLRFNQLLKTKY